jgi:hypothetical protein
MARDADIVWARGPQFTASCLSPCLSRSPQVIAALDTVSCILDTAAAKAAAASDSVPGSSLYSDDAPIPWPIYVTLANCNIALRDSLPIRCTA